MEDVTNWFEGAGDTMASWMDDAYGIKTDFTAVNNGDWSLNGYYVSRQDALN